MSSLRDWVINYIVETSDTDESWTKEDIRNKFTKYFSSCTSDEEVFVKIRDDYKESGYQEGYEVGFEEGYMRGHQHGLDGKDPRPYNFEDEDED